ncbi:MAG TPA: DUF3576 domain-containing protein [Stellaceae bacterium]|jgi:hypothetical protein|nr:DUF3576 domain-containing protein [Stellaceae bacterium]
MFVRHYGLLFGVAASISLSLSGCGSGSPAAEALDPATGAVPASVLAARKAAQNSDNSDETIWTVLGLAKRDSERSIGPQTGAKVSPILWEAAHDALKFTGVTSEDAMSGLLVTNWYSPPGKPNERLRVSVFILSRALRSDSLSVTIERQTRSGPGQWQDAPVDREVGEGLENAILQRARQIHSERYRGTMYN